MNKKEVLDALVAVIANNSNLEADDDDMTVFYGIDDVRKDDDSNIYIHFKDGNVLKLNIS